MMGSSITCFKVLLLFFSTICFTSAQTTSVIVGPDTVKVGEQAMLTCAYTLVSGDSLSGLAWAKSDSSGNQVGDNALVTNSDTESRTNGRFSLSNDNSLVISNVEIEDAGYYLCRISTENINTAEDFTNLTVNYIEAPVLTPANLLVKKNDTATFRCPLPDGVPTPTITWIKDGNLLDVSDAEKYPQSNTTLEITKVNEMDEGVYQCRAENAAYSGEEGKLSNTGTLVSGYVKITTMEWVGGKVTCRAEGSPTPTVSIEVDQSKIATGTGYATASVPCDTSSIVRCISDNNVNSVVSEKFEACEDACKSNPCLNGGICTSSSSSVTGFSCDCESGFKGDTCEDEGSNAGLIAGVVIAVIVVIVLIVILVFLYCKKRNQKTPEKNTGYSSKPADVEVSFNSGSRQPLKTGDESSKSGLGVNKDLQKSNEMLFDAREDAKMYNQDGGKPVGVMI